MKPILISLSPNIEKDDVVLAGKVILQPKIWRDVIVTQKIEFKISHYLGKREVVAASSGRGALYQTLKAFGIGQGDEVILQAFTCLAVAAPIRWCGAEPVYADINPESYNLDVRDVEKKISQRTKAIIIQHTFGLPGPIREVVALARQHKILVIEDLAHGLGATWQGQRLGTFGDAAILSFGRDKAISCVFGGAIASNNQSLINKIRLQQNGLRYPANWWVAQQLLHPILMDMVIPYYYRANIGKIILVAAQKMNLLSMAVTSEEKSGKQMAYINRRPSPALMRLLDNQLGKLDRFIERRRVIAKKYAAALVAGTWPEDYLNNGSWIRFPLRVGDRRQIIGKAKQQQIMLGDWYKQPVMPVLAGHDEFTGYVAGACPQAEEASRTVVNLPTHIKMTDADVERVIQFMNIYNNDQ